MCHDRVILATDTVCNQEEALEKEPAVQDLLTVCAIVAILANWVKVALNDRPLAIRPTVLMQRGMSSCNRQK